MSLEENPYRSPSELPEISSRQTSLRQLALPARLLLVTSYIGYATFCYLPIKWLVLYHRGFEPFEGEPSESLWKRLILSTLMAVGSMIAYASAKEMLKGRRYAVCLTGAVIASIPLFSPAYVLGIPFGVWSLMVLLRKDTRDAFAEVE